jgi:hypothetical protein
MPVVCRAHARGPTPGSRQSRSNVSDSGRFEIDAPVHGDRRARPFRRSSALLRLVDLSEEHARAAIIADLVVVHRTGHLESRRGWRGRLTEFPELLHTVTGLEIYAYGMTTSE